jgi:hypothetical protein
LSLRSSYFLFDILFKNLHLFVLNRKKKYKKLNE